MQLREARVGSKVLVSTLAPPVQASAQGLKELYAQRWNVELDLRNILAYNLIRLLMLRFTKLADVLPRQLSFKHSLKLWLAWSQRGLPLGEVAIEHLLVMIVRCVDRRPGRINREPSNGDLNRCRFSLNHAPALATKYGDLATRRALTLLCHSNQDHFRG